MVTIQNCNPRYTAMNEMPEQIKMAHGTNFWRESAGQTLRMDFELTG